jgi:hypothetical protein
LSEELSGLYRVFDLLEHEVINVIHNSSSLKLEVLFSQYIDTLPVAKVQFKVAALFFPEDVIIVSA